MGRRNITDEQRTYLIGKEQEARKKQHGRPPIEKGTKTDLFPVGKTAQIVADEHGVGYGTVMRAEKYAQGIDIIGQAKGSHFK